MVTSENACRRGEPGQAQGGGTQGDKVREAPDGGKTEIADAVESENYFTALEEADLRGDDA